MPFYVIIVHYLGAFFLPRPRNSKIFMKNIKIEINNLGKLKKAQVRLGNFTVFAGDNNAGKSLVAKALYSIFRTRHDDYFSPVLKLRLRRAMAALQLLPSEMPGALEMEQALQDLWENIQACSAGDEIYFSEHGLERIQESLTLLENNSQQIIPALEKKSRAGLKSLVELFELKQWSLNQWRQEGLSEQIKENFICNFQTKNLKHLCFETHQPQFSVKIPEVVDFVMRDEKINCKFSSRASRLNSWSRSIYLGSPMLWTLSGPLAFSERNRMMKSSERVPGVPKHFQDTLAALDETGRGKSLSPSVEKRMSRLIGGKLEFKNDEFTYCPEKQKNLPLTQAGAGVVTPGMLGLLVEKNLLVPGAFLFIEDPEVNLHPAGQVEMARALFEVAEKGVNIILTTHSADILKWLEVKVKDAPATENKIALNHFTGGGIAKTGDKSLTEQLNNIQKDLTDPYYRLYCFGTDEAQKEVARDAGGRR